MNKFKVGDIVYHWRLGLCEVVECNVKRSKISYLGEDDKDGPYLKVKMNGVVEKTREQSKFRLATDEDIISELSRRLTTFSLGNKTLFLNDDYILICEENESISLTREDLKKILELVNV